MPLSFVDGSVYCAVSSSKLGAFLLFDRIQYDKIHYGHYEYHSDSTDPFCLAMSYLLLILLLLDEEELLLLAFAFLLFFITLLLLFLPLLLLQLLLQVNTFLLGILLL